MSRSFKTVADVASRRLCLGCGACAFICPERAVALVNVLEEGIRPRVGPVNCGDCTACLDVCPGLGVDYSEHRTRPGADPALLDACGPVLEIWEGHACDPEIRFTGSSGGLLTALSLYCLEREGMHGVLHVGAAPGNPIANVTGLSRSRAELMERTGSRYAPASVCDGLAEVHAAPAPCVLVGQPSEAAALRLVMRQKPALAAKVGVCLSFFCAGSPATRGTLELLKRHGFQPGDVGRLRYRGLGWPGHFAVTRKGEEEPAHQMTYRDSWHFLQAFRPYATHLWPDGAGEDADIACGDPWYRKNPGDEAGSSLVVVRTEVGRRIVEGARAAGYVLLKPATPTQLLQSQEGLVDKKRSIWGRLLAFRLIGLPVPDYQGMPLFQLWRRLPFKEKLRSVVGTARRAIQRGYRRPLRFDQMETWDLAGTPVKTSASSKP